ncbi:hypothetical protein SAMN04488109_1149 [Chryseolinea serpens]|uniref:Uncharacterized protein n=1 Tax=Chryseolinea serpens TaxID=947013 RepID=A0A1M5LDE1_9BACT|nr:hypothetical protein [Chryseolinea serpens]SHG62996.1 hypothetical protein SAMN04488109_1149 [Chryseolinea serpens]
MNASTVNEMRGKYLAADYSGVIQGIEDLSDKFKSDEILNDDDLEILALASFSYFNTDDYENTLFYAVRLVKYVISNRRYDDSRNLFENSVMIVVDSLLHKKREIKAYFFLRKTVRYVHKDGEVGRRVMQHFDSIRNNIAERLGNMSRYLVLILGFILVALQKYFHFLSPKGNLLMSAILVFLVLFGWKWNYLLIRIIRKAL